MISYKYFEENRKSAQDKIEGVKTDTKYFSLKGFSQHTIKSVFGGHPALSYQPPLVEEKHSPNLSFEEKYI